MKLLADSFFSMNPPMRTKVFLCELCGLCGKKRIRVTDANFFSTFFPDEKHSYFVRATCVAIQRISHRYAPINTDTTSKSRKALVVSR